MGKRFNRGNRESVLHFVTLNVRDRKPLFQQAPYARGVLQQLRITCDTHPARLIAYIAMPDHLHYIINPRDGDILQFLAHFKSAASLQIQTIAAQLAQQHILEWLIDTPDHHPQLFQDGKHSLDLYSEWMIWQKINYIHNNPMRWRLVRHANEYPYSSFVAMYGGEGVSVMPIDREYGWGDGGE